MREPGLKAGQSGPNHVCPSYTVRLLYPANCCLFPFDEWANSGSEMIHSQSTSESGAGTNAQAQIIIPDWPTSYLPHGLPSGRHGWYGWRRSKGLLTLTPGIINNHSPGLFSFYGREKCGPGGEVPAWLESDGAAPNPSLLTGSPPVSPIPGKGSEIVLWGILSSGSWRYLVFKSFKKYLLKEKPLQWEAARE